METHVAALHPDLFVMWTTVLKISLGAKSTSIRRFAQARRSAVRFLTCSSDPF